MKKRMVAAALLCLAGSLLTLNTGEAKKSKNASPDGQKVFQQHCASCHVGGGNRIKPGKPLAESKVLSSLPQFKAYLSSPPGHMPYYEQLVNDQNTLKALLNFCKTLKKQPIKPA